MIVLIFFFQNVEVCGYMDVIVVVYLVVDIWLFKFVNKIVGEIWKYFQKLVIFVVNKVDLVRGCVVLIKGMFIIFYNFIFL